MIQNILINNGVSIMLSRKKTNILFVLFLFIFLIIPINTAVAQGGELKIAIVDYNKVFYEYSMTRTQYIRLKKEKEKLETYIEEKQAEIEEDKKIFDEQKQFYDEGRQKEELLKIWMKMLALEMKIKEETDKLERAEQTVVKRINDSINTAIEQARSYLGYDIVINKHSVFAVGDGVEDITDYVVNILSKT